MTTLERNEQETFLAPMSYDRTLDRALVHRDALSEVFVTDTRGDRDGFTVAAQLPTSHAYYGDHVARTSAPDPLLVLECCRQAETLGVHLYFDAPLDTTFVLRRWALDLPGLADVAGARRPARCVVTAVPHDVVVHGGALRSAEYAMTVEIDGHPVGDAALSVGYVPGSAYGAVRRRQRGSTPPLSSELMVDRSALAPVPARQVGRHDARNVLLERAEHGPGGTSTLLVPAVDHPSLFDHAQDHVPGMTLMEAARQAAVLSCGAHTTAPPEYLMVTGLDARFLGYTELDRLARVHATVPRRAGDAKAVTVTVAQDDQPTVEVDVLVSRPPRTGEAA